MLNHTPGPWEVQGIGFVTTSDDFMIAEVKSGPSTVLGDAAGAIARRRANARLIAEAPVMLAALRQYRNGESRLAGMAADAILTRLDTQSERRS